MFLEPRPDPEVIVSHGGRRAGVRLIYAMQKKPVSVKAPHVEAAELDRARELDHIRSVADELFDRYIRGGRFYDLVQELVPGVPLHRVRYIISVNDDLQEAWAAATLERSHYMIEENLAHAKRAAAVGDPAGYRVAIDTHFKMAAKLNAATYGDTSKVELTGKDGGPVKMQNMTDEDLLKIAAQAVAKGQAQ